MFHQNLRNNQAPQKIEKWPCSIKKFEKRPCSIEKFEKWPCSIKKLIWPGSTKFENRPCSIKKFAKQPCSIKKWIQRCSTKMWQMVSNSGGTWSFLKLAWSLLKFFNGVWSLLKFLWSMVVSQILAEPGHINFPPEFEKWQCSTRIWDMTMFHQILRPFVTFWWNTVIFIFRWSMVAFQIFWWSMVASQIFVEHGRFSNFGGTLSFLLFLVEHGPFSNFLAPVISLPLHSDW